MVDQPRHPIDCIRCSSSELASRAFVGERSDQGMGCEACELAKRLIQAGFMLRFAPARTGSVPSPTMSESVAASKGNNHGTWTIESALKALSTRPSSSRFARGVEDGAIPGQDASNRIPAQGGGGVFEQEEATSLRGGGSRFGRHRVARSFPSRSHREAEVFGEIARGGSEVAVDISAPNVAAEMEQLQTRIAQL